MIRRMGHHEPPIAILWEADRNLLRSPGRAQLKGENQHISRFIWMFPKMRVPQNGGFIMENPIKMDDLGVALFSETPIYVRTKRDSSNIACSFTNGKTMNEAIALLSEFASEFSQPATHPVPTVGPNILKLKPDELPLERDHKSSQMIWMKFKVESSSIVDLWTHVAY